MLKWGPNLAMLSRQSLMKQTPSLECEGNAPDGVPPGQSQRTPGMERPGELLTPDANLPFITTEWLTPHEQ
jgi:hypothetical protein